MKIRHFLFCLIILAALPTFSYAQSSMSDSQVMQYIMKEQAKGTSQAQIVTKLIDKGVQIDQIRRIRKQYQQQKGNDNLGAKDLTGSSDMQSRLRKNNSKITGRDEEETRRSKNSSMRRSAEESRDADMDLMSDRQKRIMQQNERDEYLDELDFVLPDSTKMMDEKYKKELDKDKKNVREVFGRSIFNQKELSFEPNMNIATPSDYRLGPGDEVNVDIWGASQKSVSSTVSPDGTIDIEGYGPVSVSGLSVSQANARLRATVGQRYRNSQIRLTVGQTKTILVNVFGEVNTPGTYTLSAFATVFHALYAAGGINDIGTLRNIKVYRRNKLVTTVDVYDYILNGKLSGNIKLSSNDVIVVGPYEALVDIQGKIKRPMLYEMKKSESVATLIKYAGGFKGDAFEGNIRLTRKAGGIQSIYNISEFERGTFQLLDGDSVAVDSVLNRFKNAVEVRGAAFRPGLYQMDGNINTIRQLILQAGGPTENAYVEHAVLRRRKADRSLETVSIDLQGIIDQTVSDVPLRNEDVLFIPSKKDVQEEKTLTINGEVQFPGVYDYADNTSIVDLIMQAGGLKDAASLMKIDVSRRIRNNKATEPSSIISRNYTFSMQNGLVVEGQDNFKLEPFDEVYIRKSPGYVEQQHVSIEGEIAFEGSYALSQKSSRLSDLVSRAGGVTKEAYIKGAHLERKLTSDEKIKQASLTKLLYSGDSISLKKIEQNDMKSVGINLEQALANPGNNKWDIVLRDGDKLVIPQYNNTVSVNGEVMYPNSMAYVPNAGLSYYVNSAGGFTLNAKTRRAFAINMNGTVSRIRSSKDIQPGCDIVVPMKPKKKGISLTEIVGLGSIVASMVTAIAVLMNNSK